MYQPTHQHHCHQCEYTWSLFSTRVIVTCVTVQTDHYAYHRRYLKEVGSWTFIPCSLSQLPSADLQLNFIYTISWNTIIVIFLLLMLRTCYRPDYTNNYVEHHNTSCIGMYMSDYSHLLTITGASVRCTSNFLQA